MTFFSKNLQYLRKKKKLNQKEFGVAINLKRDAIASLENERVKPSYDTLIAIRNFLNINLDDLIFLDLEEKEKKKNKLK